MTRRGPLGALVLALAALGGCGGSEEGPTRPGAAGATAAEPVDIDPEVGRAGSVAQLADCAYWRRASREERYATIADIRGQHTPQQSTTAASPLDDDRAYAVFQRACRPEFARSLRLYKLYVRVQGFAPLTR